MSIYASSFSIDSEWPDEPDDKGPYSDSKRREY